MAEAPWAAAGNSGAPVLRFDVWEGPLDLLLELARAQRVDLTRISVAELAAQFVTVLEAAIARRAVPLSRLAEWTIMAAWLLVLRSRLLLPAGTAESAEAEREAADLRRHLADREAARRLANWLEQRVQHRARDLCARDSGASRGGRARGRRDRAAAGLPEAAASAAARAGVPAQTAPALAGTGRPGPDPRPATWPAGGCGAGAVPAAAGGGGGCPVAPQRAGQHTAGRARALPRRRRRTRAGQSLRDDPGGPGRGAQHACSGGRSGLKRG